ncbi:MAG: ABC transporter permease [Bacteroidia bacterium]|nr:ABC transporter permease [Bacteroidia bacterium]
MLDYDKWQEIIDSISKHKLRTALTAFGVSWGMFMLVLLLGAGNGLRNGVNHNFLDDAVNSLWIWGGSTSKPYKGLQPGRRIIFHNEDYKTVEASIGAVEHLGVRYWLRGGAQVKRGNEVFDYPVRCVNPGHRYLENTIITEGRFINDHDMSSAAKITVIGQLVRDAFFTKDEAVIGQYINIKGIDFKIVGVYLDEGQENEMRNIYIPVYTAQKVFEGDDIVDQIMFTMGDISVENSALVEADVQRLLAERLNFDPEDKQAIYISNDLEEYMKFQSFFQAIKIFVWIVGLGSILAGMIGVSNIMLIIVKDRTKEIGIRKAVGATPASIISMILHESVLITAVAGFLGLCAGIGILWGLESLMTALEIESEFFRNPEVNFGVLAWALFTLVVTGALAGLIPGMKAVRINPVEAMKG